MDTTGFPTRNIVLECVDAFAYLPLHAGAIAAVDAFSSSASSYARAPINCSGVESNLNDCIDEFQLTSSCDTLGTASAVCGGMLLIFGL